MNVVMAAPGNTEHLTWHLNVNLGKWERRYGMTRAPSPSWGYQGYDTPSLLHPLEIAKNIMGPFV